jgi:hypothetical protein
MARKLILFNAKNTPQGDDTGTTDVGYQYTKSALGTIVEDLPQVHYLIYENFR